MRTTLLLLVFLCTTVLHARPDLRASPEAGEARALVEGVSRLAMPGVPGTLTVFGPEAFPVVAAESGGRAAPLVGATRLGKGRAVLFGHGYFGAALQVGDTARFVENVLRWLANDKREPRIGVRGRTELARHLGGKGLSFVSLDGAGWTTRLDEVDALVVHLAHISESELTILRRKIKAGLGVASGMPGWGWQQLNPGKELATDNMANRLLASAGLVWGAEYMKKPKSGVLRVAGPAPELSHASTALSALVEQAEGRRKLSRSEGALAVATVTRAIREVPPGDKLLLPEIGRLLKHSVSDPRLLPRPEAPLTDEQGLAKLLLTLQLQSLARSAPDMIKAHPAAHIFPGAVDPVAHRGSQRLSIDTGIPGWHSTGLYAAPGEVVSVRVPESAASGGLALRIGAHKDKLWGKARWRRAPDITVQRPIAGELTRVACAFGGLIYVVIPTDCSLGAVSVEINGAVESPHFVLGQTSPERWKEHIRRRPAPWAELETKKVIITIPSEHVRSLEDPESLMRWWDRVMDGCADLATISHERARPERYVADEQISVGYMHSGYPIMTHLDAAPRFVDLATLSTQGDWGMFHEMGHNHQHRDWTFNGTVEVTCNLFSLYLMETVCSRGGGHAAMSPANIRKNRMFYKKGGSKFGLWKTKPFTALIMYDELRAAFGWTAYKKAFAAYRDLDVLERPTNDDEKRDQWLIRMSRAVGRDLGPFFAAWGIPVSAKARNAVKGLPEWMP